ncbi:hypothetical protein HBI62_145860 [Parastagonospora nodorum]|nr:hypothetical protein HBH71_097970 [Parastagonospora nodorum]KAH5219316.1 hypothetical protein HBI62_145860 [Parastagonospora nodorum]KAH5262291.1 hypothetical protein HBI72_106910 [Parastagonospora nodorum]KAH5670996.1 hypothetical protein HBI21_178200 [Parastagonospora nodorum]KAH6043541.1 hypothetical protein HBI54_118370 [Parastagonospora nodorum]
MSFPESLVEHPFARINVSPDAQEVIDAMKKVHGFNEAVHEIICNTKAYMEMVEEQQTLAPKTKEEHQKELEAVNKKGKPWIGKYLRCFTAEYLEHGKNELRTWSFPKIVWEHFQQMVRTLYPDTGCPEPDICFNKYGITLFDTWDTWAAACPNVPPFLRVFNQLPAYADFAFQEMEIRKMDKDQRYLQLIYQVWCGPRLCGTMQSDGTCHHSGQMHQFTKKPRGWVNGRGWTSGNVYQIGHETSVDLDEQHWVAIFDMEDGKLVKKRDYDWTEFYDDWSNGYPKIYYYD